MGYSFQAQRRVEEKNTLSDAEAEHQSRIYAGPKRVLAGTACDFVGLEEGLVWIGEMDCFLHGLMATEIVYGGYMVALLIMMLSLTGIFYCYYCPVDINKH